MIRQDGDQSLLLASCAGDIGAFAKIYKKYQGDVYAVCLAVLQDPDLAEDAVQDTFLKAFLGLSRFKAGKPLGPWLRTIARRRCIDIRRRVRDASLDEMTENGENLDLDWKDPFSDPTLEQVLDAETMARLRRALTTLPPRQRRALILFAVEGWNYADIATVEGSSITAINMLLLRARKKIRQKWETLGLAAAPWRGLRERLNAAINRIQRNPLYTEPDRWAVFGTQALLSAGLALCVCLFAQPGSPASAGEPGWAPVPPASRPISGSLVNTAQAAVSERNSLASPQGGKAQDQAGAPDAAPVQAVSKIAEQFDFEPTPENTSFTSIAPSPNYAEDHTVFATGMHSVSYPLFVSRDGGASWELLPALGLVGWGSYSILIPPSYARDGRIFAMDWNGLKESLDGGRTFTLVSPVIGQAVVSPGFESGDRRIIINGNVAGLKGMLFEYLVDKHQTRSLVQVGMLDGGDSPREMALSPNFPLDPTILFSRDAGIRRCASGGCEDIAIGWMGTIRFSPTFKRDGAVYAHKLWDNSNPGDSARLMRSADMMSSYEFIAFPAHYSVSNVTVLPVMGSTKIFVTGWRNDSQQLWPYSGEIYVSENQGDAWKMVRIDMSALGVNGGSIIATSTGRLIASVWPNGIACSEDGGRSWQARCSPQP